MRAAPTDLLNLLIWCSLFLALGVGLPVALVVTLERSGGLATGLPLADLIAFHGTVQLWGFTVLFILGMALRLMGIFARGPLPLAVLPFAVAALTIAALCGRFIALLIGTDSALHAGQLFASLTLFGSAAAFLAIVLVVLYSPRLRSRRTVISFAVGASLLSLAGFLEGFAAFHDDGGFYGAAAISLSILGGFAVAFIAGVASRSLKKKPWPEGLFMAVFGGVVGLACLMLTYVSHVDASVLAIRATSALLSCMGILWLAIVGIVGVFSRAADRPGVASKPHLLLVRSAFLWLVVAGVVMAVTGAAGALQGDLPSVDAMDAVRHSLGVGVVANLILGMSLLLLPAFGSDLLSRPFQRTMALALLLLVNSAAVLRVGSILVDDADAFRFKAGLQAAAGATLEVALIVFCVALVTATRRQRRELQAGH